MNILFIIGGNDKGGVLTWLTDLSKELTKTGVKLSFAASLKGKSYTALSSYGKMHILLHFQRTLVVIVLRRMWSEAPSSSYAIKINDLISRDLSSEK